MSQDDLEEAKKLFKEISTGLAEIKIMLNELKNISKEKERLKRLIKRYNFYI